MLLWQCVVVTSIGPYLTYIIYVQVATRDFACRYKHCTKRKTIYMYKNKKHKSLFIDLMININKYIKIYKHPFNY